MWQPGQEWRPVDSLERLDRDVRAYAPRAVPPATDVDAWGFLADDAHSVDSDHYPHFYPELGPTAVVCAHDMPHAPALGLDAHMVTESLRVSRDPRIGYVICDHRIFSGHVVDGVPAFTWRPYTGSDPHDTHFHVSTVHTAAADQTQPWAMPGGNRGEEIMLYRNPANGGIYLSAGGALVGVQPAEWTTLQADGQTFVNLPATLIARALAASAQIDLAALVAALVPLLAPALAAALPDNIDAAAVIAAFDDAHVQQVLADQAEAGIRAL